MNLRTFTLREASKETGIPVPTIRKLIAAKKVTAVQTGNRWRVNAASLEAFVNPTPAPIVSSAKSFPEVEDRFR